MTDTVTSSRVIAATTTTTKTTTTSSSAGAASAASAAAKPTSKLNPAAKSFVFSPNAREWTPTKAVATAATPPHATSAAPVSSVSSAAATPAARAAASPSVLKASAKEWVPSYSATPFVPSQYLPRTPVAPVQATSAPVAASPVKAAETPAPTSSASTPIAAAAPAPAPVPAAVPPKAVEAPRETVTETAAPAQPTVREEEHPVIAEETAVTESSSVSSVSSETTHTEEVTTKIAKTESVNVATTKVEIATTKVEIATTKVVTQVVEAAETQAIEEAKPKDVMTAPVDADETKEALSAVKATVAVDVATVKTEVEASTKTEVNTTTSSAATPAASSTVTKTEVIKKTEVISVATVDGRITYSIAQLLEMVPAVCTLPAGVDNKVILAGKNARGDEAGANGPRSSGGARRDSSRSLNRSNSGAFGEGRGRGRRGGRGSRAPPEPPAEDVEPLKINEETRWKPSHTKSKTPADDAAEIDVTENALKEAKAILNKLSMERFEKLSNQLIDVAVRSIAVLEGVIAMVIEKAQQEWHFGAMYAELCRKISQTEMPAIELDDNETVQDTHKLFRKLLLSRCQKTFEETPSREGWDLLSEEERAEKELLLKRGTLGHIRFVGELYKQRMLSSRIMHECVQRLFGDLNAPDEESLECLCNLLTTIGKTLDASVKEGGEKDLVRKYYSTIQQLAKDSTKLGTRVRFLLQDLLDLRRNNWVARRKETKAMTIAQVHAEAEREEREKAKAAAAGSSRGGSRLQRSLSMNATIEPHRGGRETGGKASAAWKSRANVPTPPASAPTDADGWTTAGTGRPRLLKSRSTVSLGGENPHSVRNSFSVLRAADSNHRRSARERSTSASVSRSRLPTSPIAAQGAAARPPRSTPTPSSAPSSPERSDKDKAAPAKAPPLPRAVFARKVKSIVEEFVELRDMDEAVECVKELASTELISRIASQALILGLEKGTKERDGTGDLLQGLGERELLTTEAWATALGDVMASVEDLEIDIPLTLPYLAEMLVPSIVAGYVTLAQLVTSAEPLTARGKAAKLVGSVLSGIQDDEVTQTLVTGSALDLTTVLAEDQRTRAGLEAFCAQHHVEFLL